MPDISMCDGGGCQVKKNCHRYTAKHGDYQCWFSSSPALDLEEDQECKYFWDNKEYEDEVR